MLDCKGKCRLWEVLELLGICIYTIIYKPQCLELHVGLRPTCWNFPWVDASKAIVKNKETLVENQLLQIDDCLIPVLQQLNCFGYVGQGRIVKHFRELLPVVCVHIQNLF